MPSSIESLLRIVGTLEIKCPDGDIRRLRLRSRPADWKLAELRKRGRALPAPVNELLAIADGMDFFGVEVEGSLGMIPHDEQGVLMFHNWGNGDFDVIGLPGGKTIPEGSIAFANHSPDVLVPIANSLVDWFDSVLGEIKSRHTLLHPVDYIHSPHVDGVYSGVLRALRGIRCEITSDPVYEEFLRRDRG